MTDAVFSREAAGAVLDEAHVGDIRGAFGAIRADDTGRRIGWRRKLSTLLAILGPGLIVMVGDNDAGAFATYGQAGQTYGTTLLWTLALLVPVLYVNQEMVLRLGAVTGVGHARLIFERFGRFWGAFSVIDLFLLNALTIVTEFIGISLALDYLGVNKYVGVAGAAALVIASVSTGDFRRFERFSMLLVAGSLLLLPVYFLSHPPMAQMAHDFVTPAWPSSGKTGDVMMLVIGLVGTTVAPWQLFFQQSYVIDKRITPRFIAYERLDLWIGIALVVLGAAAIIGFTAATFAGKPEFGHFTDAGGIAAGLDKYVGHAAGVMFAFALIDAAMIGAAAVSLSTAYAIGDVFSARHSLHRPVSEAKAFYAVYALLVLVSAAVVLTPGAPLGLMTVAVQALAGVLLPSATVFLLLLCNDKAVLGPWANGRGLNALTGAVIAALVALSAILTVSVLFPDASVAQMLGWALGGGAATTALAYGVAARGPKAAAPTMHERLAARADPARFRMAALSELPPMRLSASARTALGVLRLYLVVAGGLVLWRIVALAVWG